MLKLTVKAAKGGFFDRPKVLKAMDRAARRVLSRFGAFVRTRARTSIRKRKGTSAPGGPPYSHVGHLRNFMFFVYEPERKAVVIGPARLNRVVDPRALPALEFGGRSTLETRRERRTITIRPRPFMGPALEAERPKLAGMFKDSLRSS